MSLRSAGGSVGGRASRATLLRLRTFLTGSGRFGTSLRASRMVGAPVVGTRSTSGGGEVTALPLDPTL